MVLDDWWVGQWEGLNQSPVHVTHHMVEYEKEGGKKEEGGKEEEVVVDSGQILSCEVQ